MKEIYLAAGCFWGAEKYLGLIDGVVATEVGFANGTILLVLSVMIPLKDKPFNAVDVRDLRWFIQLLPPYD